MNSREYVEKCLARGERWTDNGVQVDIHLAEELLALCDSRHQRPLSAAKVNLYNAEMLAGEWRLGGSPLAISTARRLINGQHRLEAMIMAPTPLVLPFDILWGADDEEFLVTDIGRNRSGGDFLAIAARSSSGSAAKAAILRSAYNYTLRRAEWKTWRSLSLSPRALIEEADRWGTPQLEEALAAGSKLRRVGLNVTPCAVAYLVQQRAWPAGHAELDAFVDELATGCFAEGTGLPKGHPAKMLRDWALFRRPGHQMGVKRTKQEVPDLVLHLHLFLRCFALRCNHQVLGQISYKSENFVLAPLYQGPSHKQ